VSPTLVLGLDVGTTAVKAALLDADGGEVGQGRAATPWRPVPTGAEADPHELQACAETAARAALARAPAGRVAAIGVAGMAETGVLLDARGRPVVGSIAWHDSRGADEAERLARELGRETFAERTGLTTRPLSSLVKYAWMRAHWPDSEKGVRWLNVPEWIVRRLGGEDAAEASLASRTGFYDLHTGAPWDAALAWVGAPAGLAPEHLPAGSALGTAGDGLPRAAGAVLAVGGHDHLAAAIGTGAAGEGDVIDSCGTAEAWVQAAAPLTPERVREAVAGGLTVGWHAVAGRHAVIGSIRSGAVLGAVLDLLGVRPEERGELERAALEAETGALALSGLRGGPVTVEGIEAGGSPAALYRAALEAIGAAGAQVLAGMEAVAGRRSRLVVTGGWAAGEAARAVKARHLGPFEYVPAAFAGARGAALAAGRAAGMWPADDAPVAPASGTGHPSSPDPIE
jgi:sugar (pentulose or hexulose) kinase